MAETSTPVLPSLRYIEIGGFARQRELGADGDVRDGSGATPLLLAADHHDLA